MLWKLQKESCHVTQIVDYVRIGLVLGGMRQQFKRRKSDCHR
jgi:hypothetical protein